MNIKAELYRKQPTSENICWNNLWQERNTQKHTHFLPAEIKILQFIVPILSKEISLQCCVHTLSFLHWPLYNSIKTTILSFTKPHQA